MKLGRKKHTLLFPGTSWWFAPPAFFRDHKKNYPFFFGIKSINANTEWFWGLFLGGLVKWAPVFSTSPPNHGNLGWQTPSSSSRSLSKSPVQAALDGLPQAGRGSRVEGWGSGSLNGIHVFFWGGRSNKGKWMVTFFWGAGQADQT